MARPIRMALDLALVSIKTVRGPLSNLWFSAKRALIGTAARPIFDNKVIEKLENGMSKTTDFLITQMGTLRDSRLEGEKLYLQKELEKVNRKLQNLSSSKSSSSSSTICESAKPCVSETWQYAKVEMVPPMTQSFFQGIGGKTIENAASIFGNGTIAALRSGVAAIDAAVEAKRQAVEEALKAKQEKAAAEAKLAAEEKAKQAEAAKVKAAEAKAAAEKAKPKPAEPAKAESKTAPAAKPAAKPEPKKTEAKKPEAKKSETKKPETKKAEAKKPDPPKKK